MFPQLQNVAKRRKMLGMTQHQLATTAGVSQSLIAKIEAGTLVPSYDIAGKIFAALDALEHKGEKLARDVMHKHVIVLKSSDSVAKAVALAKKHSISQFPVIDNGRIVGAITSVSMMGAPKSDSVGKYLTESFPTVGEDTPLSAVKQLLLHHPAVLVLKAGRPVGIVSAEDLL